MKPTYRDLQKICSDHKAELQTATAPEPVNCKLPRNELETLLKNANLYPGLTDEPKDIIGPDQPKDVVGTDPSSLSYRELQKLCGTHYDAIKAAIPDEPVKCSATRVKLLSYLDKINHFDVKGQSTTDKGLLSITADIASLICIQTTPTNDINTVDEIMRKLRACPKANCSCKNLAQKIAISLIRIASERIFAEPEQSVVELVVNSIDSYYPNEKIGKFGFGFFSILYWIVGHPKRYIQITSNTKDGNYVSKISQVGGILQFTLELNPADKGDTPVHTGTKIEINTVDDPFTNENFINFNSKLHTLRHKTNVTIDRDKPGFGQSKDTVLSDKPLIRVLIEKNGISVEDYATGIPLGVLLESLYIPSVSTKTIKLQAVPELNYVNKSHIEYTKANFSNKLDLEITVADITVVAIEGDTAQLSMGHQYVFVASMPKSTRLPVARDDIILDNPFSADAAEFERSIHILFKKSIEIHKDISMLQSLLNKYMIYTVSEINKILVTKVMKDVYDKHKQMLIPVNLGSIFDSLAKGFITSLSYDIFEVQKTLDALTKPLYDVWYGKKVLILPTTDLVFDIGISTYIAVSATYVKANPDWKTSLPLIYTKETLLPANLNYSHSKYAFYIKYIKDRMPKMNTDDTNYCVMAISKFNALDIYFNNVHDPTVSNDFLESLLYIVRFPGWRDIIVEMLARFIEFKGNTTYGGGKYSLKIRYVTYELANSDKAGKLHEFNKNAFSLYFKSIQEENITVLDFSHPLMPLSLFIDHLLSPLAGWIFNLSKNFKQYILLMDLFYSYLYNNKAYVAFEANSHYISKLIEKIDTVATDSIVTGSFGDKGLSSYTNFGKLKYEVETWYNNIESLKLQVVNPKIPNTFAYTVHSSQLINYAFKYDINKSESLNSILDKLLSDKSLTDPSDLQMLEIAINEGTTRPALDASLSELIQNSVDAIRSNVADTKDNGCKNVTVRTYVSEGSNFILTIHDCIGIDAWAFLHLSIPFLSTKGAESMKTTGEMGSGFFNVYRSTEYVIVSTIKDGTHIYSLERPIYDGDRVIDVEKRINIEKVPSGSTTKNGTTVTLVFKSTEDKLFSNSIVDYHMRNTFSLIDKEDAVITFNGSSIAVEQLLLYSDTNYEIRVPSKRTLVPSAVLTKGIPFSSLMPYLFNYFSPRVVSRLSDGLFINIKGTGYTPVQSRSKITITGGMAKFITMLTKAAALRALTNLTIENVNKSTYIPNYRSTASAKSIRFNIFKLTNENLASMSNSNILINCKLGPKISIARLINKGIEIMGDDVYGDWQIDIDNTLRDMLEKAPNLTETCKMYIREIVESWLESKNTVRVDVLADQAEQAEIGSVPISEDVVTNQPFLTKFIRNWVTLYVKIGVQLQIKNFNKNMISKVTLVAGRSEPKGKHANGWRVVKTKEIAISTKYLTMNPKHLKQLESLWTSKLLPIEILEQLKQNELWNSVFAYSFPAATLIHEIEHARNNTGTHDSAYESLGPTEKPVMRTYEEACNAVYQKIIEAKFYDQLKVMMK
jgi:hypothetical protein